MKSELNDERAFEYFIVRDELVTARATSEE